MSLSAEPAPWPGVADRLPPGSTDHLAPSPKLAANPDELLGALREQIASGTEDPDTILGAIAIAAQAVTDGSGAALGMRRDGVVVCVGRSGETAPALGAKLSSESGISGECLRTGRALRCDDTETDPRVDAEVCRHLGLRSIAAVPIRSRLETVGILEVFATSQRAFTEGDLAWLGNLAELADAATSPAAAVAEAVAIAASTPWPRPMLPTQPESQSTRWRIFAALGGMIVLAALASATWKMWRGTPKPASAANAAQTPAPEAPLPVALNSAAAPKGIPERIVQSNGNRKPVSERVIAASQSERDDVVVRKLATAGNATEPRAVDSTAAPEVAVVADAGIPDLGTPAPSIPVLQHAVSQGVTPLVLLQQVTPRYPLEARMSGLGGVVVLQAHVSETGQIDKLKVVSGNSLLVKAATDAVRQWRYQPAKLNGTPISTETNITVTFKLP